jgi:peptidoglycan/xylan/chitin deacetylase (PgdA/CDA1 family)
LFSLGAYGPERGVANLLSLLRGHGITATFFVPGWIAEQWSDCVTDVVDGGHELGHHGYLHELYFDLSLEEQE